jgi:hypothetical protein
VAAAQAPAIAWSVPAEYRPSLAVLEVVASDLASIERAQQLEVELLALLATSEQFGRVMPPAEVHERLGTLEANCSTRECLGAALTRLGLHRALRVTVDEGSRVTMRGLDPSLPWLVQAELEVAARATGTPAERDLEFLARVLPRLRAALWALAVPTAKLIVETADPALPVLINGARAGQGRLEVYRAPGEVLVSIGGSLYEPAERVVTLEPGETTTVALDLSAKAVAPVVKKPWAGLMSRLGVYVTMTGLTLLTVGVGFGIGTLSTGARLAQPGSPVQVTRSDAMNAPAIAVLANVLIASGVVLSAGGIAWVALTPSKPIVPGGAEGWTLSLGGAL